MKYSREIYLACRHGTCNGVYLKVIQYIHGDAPCAGYGTPAPFLMKTMIFSNFLGSKLHRAYVSEGPVPWHSVTERNKGNYDYFKGPAQTCQYVMYRHAVSMQDTCI